MSTRTRRRAARACCAACAASAGPPTHRLGHRARPWAWLALLLLVAGLVPLAALDASEGGSALAAGGGSLAPPGAESSPPDTVAPPTAGPAPTPVPAVAWHASTASGTPNGGGLAGGVQLPVEGDGYYTYDPQTQGLPGAPERRYGTAALVHQMIALGAWWKRAHPDGPRLGVGDLAQEHGGPILGHASHQNGLDVDVRLPRRDGLEGSADPATYDRALTQQVVDRAVAQGASLVLIGPSLDLTGPSGVVLRWPSHDDHLHLRFPDPDGLGN